MNGPELILSPPQKAAWLETLRDALRIVEALPAVQRCEDCAKFDKANGCLEFGSMPPAEYQSANDCQSWDVIPF